MSNTQVTVDVIDGYLLILHNKDTSMGRYYPEDDWEIKVKFEPPEGSTGA